MHIGNSLQWLYSRITLSICFSSLAFCSSSYSFASAFVGNDQNVSTPCCYVVICSLSWSNELKRLKRGSFASPTKR